MRASSTETASTTQLQAEPRIKQAKSLFGNILAVSHYGSIFCPDRGRSKTDKLFALNILRGSAKKI